MQKNQGGAENMKNKLKRAISAAMSAVMLFSSVTFIRAEETTGESYFDFQYGNYDVHESEGTLKVKIIRHGDASAEADVALKAADFLSTYGEDYEILDEDGKALKKKEGVKPDPSDFTYDESTSGSGLYLLPDGDATDISLADEPVSDSTESMSALDAQSVDPNEPVDDNEFNGSPLLAAQAQYLNLPKAKNEKSGLTASDIQKSVDEMTKYFAEAEGAEGVVHFNANEAEKEITIVINDNDVPESDKIFMLAILAANGENVQTKANATTYVQILDDEQRDETTISIDSAAATLTKDNPSTEITIRRSGGLQYFTSVYVSTVDIDDCRNAYEEIVNKTVAFVPGETEKTITVTAKKFDKNTKFGVKLLGYDDVNIGNSLATVFISDKSSDADINVYSSNENNADVNTYADGIYLGNAKSYVYGNRFNYSYDDSPWKWEGKPDGGFWHSGHAGVWREGNGVVFDEYGEDSYSFNYTRNTLDTVGISHYSIDCYRRQDRGGYGVFETDSDQTWAGNINSAGALHSDYQLANLWLTNGHRNLYLKIGVTNHSNHERTEVKFDNIYNYWTRYTFEKRSADTKVQRKLFDFTTGDVATTYYDGETSKSVSLDGVNIKSSWGSDVAGFYGDSGSKIVFTAPDNVTKYGYVLDKVYFYNKDGNKYVAKSADANGKLEISAGQNFLGELYNNGVIRLNYNERVNDEGRSTIYVKPAYKPINITFSICKSQGFVNLDKDYGITAKDTTDSVGKPIKQYSIPKYSVLRVQYVPEANKTPMGVDCKYQIQYYKEGDQIWSTLPDRQKETVDMTDFTKAELVVDGSWIVYSKTGAQNLYIGYSPQLKDQMKKQLGGSLAGAVIDADEMNKQMGGDSSSDGNSKNLDMSQIKNKTDKDGKFNMVNVALGNTYNFRAFAPNGYYTSWADMTGDTNNDGKTFSDGDEPKTPRNYDESGKTDNYRQVIGSRININLSRDNTRYYYAFMPAVMGQKIEVTGKLQRRKASVLQLSKTRNEADIKTLSPIDGTFISIAENSAMTDSNGNFSVPLIAPIPWGAVSAYYTVDGIEYATEAQISGGNNFVIPAMSRFETVLNSVKAGYAKAENKISDGSSIITCNDDTLTISMAVQGSSTFIPTDVKFSIYDLNGNYLRDASSALFNVKKESINTLNQLKVDVSFNPKAAMNSNEELYVCFADQNGKWYNTLSTGYKFISELNLSEFVFPLIGVDNTSASSRKSANDDIIGNPLGNINLGSIKPEPGKNGKSPFTITSNDYYSPGAEQWMLANPGKTVDPQYQWTASTYNIGYKKEFSKDYKYDSKKEKEKAEKAKKEAEKKKEDDSKTMIDGFEVVEEIKEDSEEAPMDSGSNFNTKSSFKWSLSPFVSFRLTLTRRPVTNNGNTTFEPYFEDLTFMVGLMFGVSTNNTISTPIGIDVIIEAGLSGYVAGVYHMWPDYVDDWQIEGATPYTSDDFGLFKKFGPNSAVRREGYIFIDPKVSVTLGLSIVVAKLMGNATFTFDMDFQFTDKEDARGDMIINYYGDMKIDLKWWIEVLGFTVYKKEYPNVVTVELFKQNTNKHINLDSADAMIKALSDDEMSSGANDAIGNTPVSRAYLRNRGAWNSGGETQLFSSATTTEKVLQPGSAGRNNVQMVKINDNEILMLFIDDVPSRNNVNKRALYYTVGNGTDWSEPQIVLDDGTMDDYPTVSDLDDGRVLVAWSSASKAFDDDATVENALKSLDIQVAFFNKATKTFEQSQTLTKSTKEDYSADIYPHAVYDPETKRLILYYTKTEYNNLATVSSISDAASVNAYLFYEDGKWSNDGSAYSSEELDSNRMKQLAIKNNLSFEEYQNYYREQWYGQRFLDLRLSDSAELARVAETDAMYYNGLGIFTWTNDGDKNLNTAFDRDIFVQIYNFSENSFTHIIRVTNSNAKLTGTEAEGTNDDYTTSGYYNPILVRSENSTYLFFGSMNQGDEKGKISYLNISDLVGEDKLTKVTEGSTNYYVPSSETICTAVDSSNVMDYDICVDKNNKVYLFWTKAVKDGSLDIMTSMFNDSSQNEKENRSRWSEAIQLTDVDDGIYYMDLDAEVINDNIYIGAAKGNYNDEADNSLVVIKHVPTSDAVVDDISAESEHFKAGETVEVTAVVRNKDLLPEYDSVNVTFTLNGKAVDTQTIDYTIPGGFSTTVSTQIVMPENPVDIKLGAYVEGNGESIEKTFENGPDVKITEHDFEFVDNGNYIYRFTVENGGGKESNAFKVAAVYGATNVDTYDVGPLAGGETRYIEMPITIDDDEFAAERDATQMTITAEYDEKTISQVVEEVYNPYYWDVVDNIAKIKDIKFEDSYTVQIGDSIDVQPIISGVDENTLRVQWLSSSNYEPAEIDKANIIYGDIPGKTVLTGIIVPYADEFIFASDGSVEKADWTNRLPESSIVTVTAVVNVVEQTESTTEEITETTTSENTETTTRRRSGGGGGGSSSGRIVNSQVTTVTTEENSQTTTIDDISVNTDIEENNNNAGIEENSSKSTFIDIPGHWAEDIINLAAEKGIVSGYEDNTFRPDNSITRAEFIAMLYNSGLADTKITDEIVDFDDFEGNEWYSEYLKWAVANGIISGYEDNTFRGENTISREEMAVVVSKFIEFSGKETENTANTVYADEEDIATWAKPYVDNITSMAITSGDNFGNFNPKKNLTRAESAVVISKIA